MRNTRHEKFRDMFAKIDPDGELICLALDMSTYPDEKIRTSLLSIVPQLLHSIKHHDEKSQDLLFAHLYLLTINFLREKTLTPKDLVKLIRKAHSILAANKDIADLILNSVTERKRISGPFKWTLKDAEERLRAHGGGNIFRDPSPSGIDLNDGAGGSSGGAPDGGAEGSGGPGGGAGDGVGAQVFGDMLGIITVLGLLAVALAADFLGG